MLGLLAPDLAVRGQSGGYTGRELIPPGSVFAFLAEHRDVLFPPVMFADMYPSSNGRPSMPPQVLAAAVVLQSLHGLSDFVHESLLSGVQAGRGRARAVVGPDGDRGGPGARDQFGVVAGLG